LVVSAPEKKKGTWRGGKGKEGKKKDFLSPLCPGERKGKKRDIRRARAKKGGKKKGEKGQGPRISSPHGKEREKA